ncbi:hypothetical protein KQX64_07180 [Rhodopseudomonas palustris]|nr:hypothetical protein KQX64_07180 [Rhodopseudomonas palustris]
MDWSNLAGGLIKAGAPLIGGLLAGPAGSQIGGLVGGALASALGVEPTPEAVNTAIVNGDPAVLQATLSAADQKIVAEYGYWIELAKAQAGVAEKQVEGVNSAIIAEAQALASCPNKWWGHWRTIMAYELAAECPAWAALFGYCIVFGKTADLVAASSLLLAWFGCRFGVLGVHVWTGSNERQAAITGLPVKGAVTNAVASIIGKKR